MSPTPEQLAQLDSLLLSDDDVLTAQGEELVAGLAGADLLGRARLYASAGAIDRAVSAAASAGVTLPAGPTRLLACDLAERAVELVASDVVPRPGQPRRDPRCDTIIAAARAVARGERPPSTLDALLPLAHAADQHGWWETEAIYALLDGDASRALANASRALWILVHNLNRPMRAAAPQATRDGLRALLS